MLNAVERNGIGVVRTPRGIGVAVTAPLVNPPARPYRVEVERVAAGGKFVKTYDWDPAREPMLRDYYGDNVDHLKLAVRVKDGDTVLAELCPPPGEDRILPFMVRQGEQTHVTENYVSVPPALTITDEVGAVWTLGFAEAPEDQRPGGEFAFNVLRDGVDVGVWASRIERRNGQVRVFTRRGWRRWLGREFS